jgi:hypothetical protein
LTEKETRRIVELKRASGQDERASGASSKRIFADISVWVLLKLLRACDSQTARLSQSSSLTQHQPPSQAQRATPRSSQLATCNSFHIISISNPSTTSTNQSLSLNQHHNSKIQPFKVRAS